MRAILFALFLATAHAQTNTPPPDSPFVSIEESTEESKESRTQSKGDVFSKKPKPAAQASASPSTLPPFEWITHSGGGYHTLCEGAELYVAAKRFIHVFDKTRLADLGQVDAGGPIQEMACRTVGERNFVLVLTDSPPTLAVFEVAPLPALLVLKDRLQKPTLMLSAAAVFERTTDALLVYDSDTTGHLSETARIPAVSADRAYAWGHYLYLHRAKSGDLELWDSERTEALASIPLGGNPTPLGVVDGFLYFLIDDSPTALYRVPIDGTGDATGLFTGPGERLALPDAMETVRFDDTKGTLFVRPHDKREWGIYEWRTGTVSQTAWSSVWTPYAGEGVVYLLGTHALQRVETGTGTVLAEVTAGTAVHDLYLPADGKPVIPQNSVAEKLTRKPERQSVSVSAVDGLSGGLSGSPRGVQPEVADVIDAYHVVELDRAGRYVAVAAGKEGLVILRDGRSDGHSRELQRIHRRPDPSPEYSCERLFLSPDRKRLFAMFRQLEGPDASGVFVNIYDMSDPRFPIFVSQVADLPPIEDLTFMLGGSVIAVALGDRGVEFYDLTTPTNPTRLPYALDGYSVVALDVAQSGRLLCAAALEDGIVCGRFKE